MRIFRIIGRSIQNAGKSILRNFSLSMASITCSIITLILVSIGMLLSYNINNITKNIENELTIVIFMDKNITTDELNKTKEDIKKNKICYLFEGEKSVMIMDSFNIPNCSVAVCGSNFNKYQLKIL